MLNVLFVDDEQRVLQGIERASFPLPPHCRFEYAVGGKNALQALEKFRADIVVTDMRMPGMDGAELLTEVKLRWPATLRVILSGQVDGESALRTMGVAHQFVSKPCDTLSLLASLERMVSLQALLRSEPMRQLIGAITTLPSAPRIYVELNRALADPATGAVQIAAIIGRDPAITAKILQLANSAFFGRGKQIDSIRDAVTRLGVNNLRQLVLSTELFGSAAENAHAEQLQDHALLAALIAQRLPAAQHTSQAAQIAALLANVGLLLPDIEKRCAGLLNEDGLPITYAQAGAYLLGLWQIALPIVEAVAWQDMPEKLATNEFGVAGLTHVAVRLAHGRSPDAKYLQSVGMLDQLPQWQAWAEELRGRSAGAEGNSSG